MIVLGVSALYHDSAAALIRDGEVVAAAQEERFTRVKLDKSVPVHAIEYCLRAGGNLRGCDLDAVVYYDDPILTAHRFSSNVAAVAGDCEDLLSLSYEPMFASKLWIGKLLRDRLGKLGKHDELYVARHHISHAASAFYPSPFESAAILTIDGVGEWNTTAIGGGRGSSIELLKTIDYPHSLGLLYGAFTQFCGFRVNYGDYKLMGLAPYGDPKYVQLIYDNLIDVKDDGSFRLNLEYFDYPFGRTMTNLKFAELFGGAARDPEAQITKREMDIAASIQQVTEDVVIRLARTAREITGEKSLVMAGGVALNCTANGKLMREGIFDSLWIQPAAGDAGGALGAALTWYYEQEGAARATVLPDAQKGSFLGPSFSDDEIVRFLSGKGIPFHRLADEELFPTIAVLLEHQNVIGLFDGRMEFGPRALGHRSIIADSRSEQMQSRLNLRIKKRESFRPFAPAVLRNRCSDYFACDIDSPYMLVCMDVRDCPSNGTDFKSELEENADLVRIINRRRSNIPAVTHVDCSARIQTVEEDVNPYFNRVIKAFEERTGCGVVINTSFNVRGEPIVCTPEDAYRCFMNTDMDALVMEGCVLYKDEQPQELLRDDRYELD